MWYIRHYHKQFFISWILAWPFRGVTLYWSALLNYLLVLHKIVQYCWIIYRFCILLIGIDELFTYVAYYWSVLMNYLLVLYMIDRYWWIAMQILLHYLHDAGELECALFQMFSPLTKYLKVFKNKENLVIGKENIIISKEIIVKSKENIVKSKKQCYKQKKHYHINQRKHY